MQGFGKVSFWENIQVLTGPLNRKLKLIATVPAANRFTEWCWNTDWTHSSKAHQKHPHIRWPEKLTRVNKWNREENDWSIRMGRKILQHKILINDEIGGERVANNIWKISKLHFNIGNSNMEAKQKLIRICAISTKVKNLIGCKVCLPQD